MRPRVIASVLVLAAVIAGLVFWLRGRAAPAPASAGPVAAPVEAPPRPVEAAPGEPAAPPAPPAPTGRLDPEARARMLEQLATARARRTAAGAAPAVSGTPAPELPAQGDLDKEYIRAQIRELVPMLAECYEGALDEDPQLAGTLRVEFTIGGEPEVGGLVETSEVLADESTITHAGMVECVRETMYAAQFEAPTHGGKVTVRYPFTFRPAGDAPAKE